MSTMIVKNRDNSLQLLTKAKRTLCGISLLALGTTFELASHYVPEVAREISDWEDGRCVSIGVLPNGPSITVRKEKNRFVFLGMKKVAPHISVLFKNLDSAVLIFLGMMGPPQAVAENRVCVHGNNYHAMQVTRAMAIVQTYLFPGFILNKTFKRPPKLTPTQLLNKAIIMILLVPMLIKNSMK